MADREKAYTNAFSYQLNQLQAVVERSRAKGERFVRLQRPGWDNEYWAEAVFLYANSNKDVQALNFFRYGEPDYLRDCAVLTFAPL